MGRLCELSREDIEKYEDVLRKAEGLFGWTIEDCKKIVDNDRVRLLFGYHPVFMVFGHTKENEIDYQYFCVNDEGKVMSMTIDGYQININDNLVYLIDENGMHQSLQLARNKEEVDFEVSANGILIYMQYDKKKDVRTVIKYDQDVYGENGIVYSDYLRKPFYVSVESKPILRDKGLFFLGRKNAYYRLDFDIYKNRWQYDLATMQEYGSVAIAQDTISLHGGQREFSRYYRELFRIGDYFSLTGFPFLRQYKENEVSEIIDTLGFNITVPRFIADIYNKRTELTSDFQNIIDEYRQENKKIK